MEHYGGKSNGQMFKMWNSRCSAKEILEDGWTPRQNGKKDATGNRAFQMHKLWCYFPRSSEQTENLNT